MARTADPDSPYCVSIHRIGSYQYASTQPYEIDSNTGKKTYRRMHWGKVNDDLKFLPGPTYIYASPEEQSKLIFPEDWDLSEVDRLSTHRGRGRPAFDAEEKNRLYGDIWLLEQVAERTGVRHDLEDVFDHNQETVDAILTLAMFPYLTQFTYNRMVHWQEIARAPATQALTPKTITCLTQSIREKHRMHLLRLRMGRLRRDELCAVDSTSRSAYGKSLADIQWGHNKERIPLKQTNEVVVYTLDSHMPVYYRTFPGNIPDSRTLKTLLTDLEHAGIPDVILVTDRGYESLRNLEQYILTEQPMIMATKVQQKMVLNKIREIGSVDAIHLSMEIDSDSKLFFRQYDLEYTVKSRGNSTKQADRLKLHLYFNAVLRAEVYSELYADIQEQKTALEAMLKEHAILDDDQTINNAYCYFKLQYDPVTRELQSFERNEKKISKTEETAGFFAITTHKIDMLPMEVYNTYKLRDEQEKYYEMMKDQMGSDRQRNWSEAGKTGRLLILFVSMILGSYVRHVWKACELKERFSSALEMLDCMRPIRCIEHPHRAKFITPFVGDQLTICKAFGFDVPEGCSTTYTSKKKEVKKRGRPRKKVVENDS